MSNNRVRQRATATLIATHSKSDESLVTLQNKMNTAWHGVGSTKLSILKRDVGCSSIGGRLAVATISPSVGSAIKCDGITDDGKASNAGTYAASDEYINRREVSGSGASTTEH